jgi:hypothetical protein
MAAQSNCDVCIIYIFWLIRTDNTALIYINCNKSAFHCALLIRIGIVNEQINEIINIIN